MLYSIIFSRFSSGVERSTVKSKPTIVVIEMSLVQIRQPRIIISRQVFDIIIVIIIIIIVIIIIIIVIIIIIIVIESIYFIFKQSFPDHYLYYVIFRFLRWREYLMNQS